MVIYSVDVELKFDIRTYLSWFVVIAELIGLYIIAKGAEWAFSNQENTPQPSSPPNKSKKERKRERKQRLRKQLEEARTLYLKIPSDIQNTAPENLEKIEALLHERRQLCTSYEELSNRSLLIGWSQNFNKQDFSNQHYARMKREIETQETYYQEFLSLQKKSSEIMWTLYTPRMPIKKDYLERIKKDLSFFQKWDQEFIKKNMWLPAPLKIRLPHPPYTQKEIVHKIALLKQRKRVLKIFLMVTSLIFGCLYIFFLQ